MKNILKTGILALSVLIGLSGCGDFFESKPGLQEDMTDTFTNKTRTEQFLNYCYSFLLDDMTGERYFGPDNGQTNGTADRYGGIWNSCSIEANISWDWHRSHQWNLGTASASSTFVGFWWSHFYKAIANTGTFIQNVDQNPELTESEKLMYKAEARALRAIYYYHIFRQYGPLVLLGEEPMAIDAEVSELLLPRSPVDDCVAYIVQELDMAAEVLGQTGNVVINSSHARYGRIDKGQCKAYKAKLLLYAASPLFNGNTLMSDVKNTDGTQLIPSTVDPAKWETAKTAFEEFLNEFVPAYYDLHIVRTSEGEIDFYESYRQITSGNYEQSKENISAKLVWHGDLNYAITPYHEGYRNVSGVSGGMGFGVSQEFVDMFYTDKGLRIDDDPDYKDYGIDVVPSAEYYGSDTDYNDPVVPSRNYFKANTNSTLKQWANREARFYVNVTYNGSTWLFTTSTANEITTTLTRNGNSGYGIAGHDSPYTGYGFRKFARSGAEDGRDRHISANLRLADIFLGYAEVLNETGDITGAMEYVNKIRARAGVPEYGTGTDSNGKTRIAYPADKDQVRKRIQRERLVELSLEGSRFFDTRRWMVADMATGDGWIYPTYHNGGEGGDVHGLDYTSDAPQFFRKRVFQTREFELRQYLMPIPDAEVRRNPLMVQNYGWQADAE